MLKLSKLSSPLKQVMVLVSIPLLLSSTGYALFSQQLSISANASYPSYTSSQKLRVTYTRTITAGSGKTNGLFNYQITASITNNGTNGVTAWQSDFSLPSDYSSVSCTNSTCTQTSTTNSAVNSGTNGSIAPGGTVTYDLLYTTANPNYEFTSIAVSGTPAILYETISGLSATAVAGTRTKQGRSFVTPYSFTVTNNSGSNLSGWRIKTPWDSATTSVSSMSTTVNYTVTATELTILSTQSIPNNTSFQFDATFSSSSSTWTLGNLTTQGVR